MDDLHKRFVISNVVGTFLHEMAHMLISDYDIPIFGREEDACDEFQNYYLLIDEGDRDFYGKNFEDFRKVSHEIVTDNADYYFYTRMLEYDSNENPFGYHPMTVSRFFHTISIIYGADNNYFKKYLESRSISLEAAKEGQNKYYTIRMNWEKIRNENINKGYDGKFSIVYNKTKKFEKYKNLIENSKILNHELFTGNFYFPLKKEIKIIFDEEDDTGLPAYCAPKERKIFISYNYMSYFDKLYSEYNLGHKHEEKKRN